MSTPQHGDHATDPCDPTSWKFEVRSTSHFVLLTFSVAAFSVAAFLVAATADAATLKGRVVDQQGAAVPRAHVVVSSPVGIVAERSADERGGFDITGLTNGRYDVRGFADGFQGDVTTVTVADTPVSVTLTLRVSAVTDAIVVSASNVDLPLSRAGDSMSVISAEDLKTRQIESVADALRMLPGLDVSRSGGRGAITSLFPRGGGSNYTLVLVDGIRVNSFGGGYDFGHLATADIDHIEVVRGPDSALFGADAAGAVVQIVTRRGGPLRGDVLFEGGNQATERVAANAAGSGGRWSWGAGLDQNRTDGYRGVAPATGERVSNDDDHLQRVSGSIGWRNDAGVDVLATGALARDERGFPGPFGSNPIGAFTSVDRVSRGVNNTRQIGVRVANSWSPRFRQQIDANVFDVSSDFASEFGASASGTRRVEVRGREDAALNASLGVSAGVDALRERGTSTFITGLSVDPLPIERTSLAGFGEVRYASRERLFVTGGVRVERLSRDAVEANIGQFTARPAFPDQSITSVNPKLAVSYAAGETRLHASAGTGIRPPDAFEIAFTDNPNLKPERTRSVDAGIEQRFAGDLLAVGATFFYNRYDDLLVTVGRALRDASRYQTDNISNARARGLELTADGRPLTSVAVRANYTFLATEVLAVDGLGAAPPPFSVGDALIRRPRHHGTVDVTFTRNRISAFLDVTSRGQVLDVEPNFGAFGGLFSAPGFLVVNLGGAYRVHRNIDVTLRVLNAADREYEEAYGYPSLRRSVVIGVRVAAGR